MQSLRNGAAYKARMHFDLDGVLRESHEAEEQQYVTSADSRKEVV